MRRRIFILMLSALLQVACAAQPRITVFEVAPYSSEGNSETIRVGFDEPVAGPVHLDLYEFHFFQKPEWAPEEDTWPHDRQMAWAERRRLDPAAGRVSSDDPRAAAILSNVPARPIVLEPRGDRFETVWPAGHGRFYFRVRVGEEVLDPIRTMRVHCRHVDMRRVEALKARLDHVEKARRHGHDSMAPVFWEQARKIYAGGHGLRFMLRHHEEDSSRLDRLFEAPSPPSDVESLDALRAEIRRVEELFRTARASRSDGILRLDLSDRVGYPYGREEGVEVYVFENPPELTPPDHSMPSEHDPAAHAAHSAAAPITPELLARGRRLQRVAEGFEAPIPTSWQSPTALVLYGPDRRYWWTVMLTVDK